MSSLLELDDQVFGGQATRPEPSSILDLDEQVFGGQAQAAGQPSILDLDDQIFGQPSTIPLQFAPPSGLDAQAAPESPSSRTAPGRLAVPSLAASQSGPDIPFGEAQAPDDVPDIPPLSPKVMRQAGAAHALLTKAKIKIPKPPKPVALAQQRPVEPPAFDVSGLTAATGAQRQAVTAQAPEVDPFAQEHAEQLAAVSRQRDQINQILRTHYQKEQPRSLLRETASALAAGGAGTMAAFGGAGEALNVPGAAFIRRFYESQQQRPALQRPKYLEYGTFFQNLRDPTWLLRITAENAPNLAATMIPGAAVARGAKALGASARLTKWLARGCCARDDGRRHTAR
jgi:hypothetical protein